ncbi:hypothetical protein [Parvularcula sp. IMCC14364]|uniref:hypothetical protein n=1 Tax=Parvularcula sp. IMCC14364 TaxID=3067902 RepID=UPI0027429B43|nr:hypothetical protein [Parvularcula sp. IMCC14364]
MDSLLRYFLYFVLIFCSLAAIIGVLEALGISPFSVSLVPNPLIAFGGIAISLLLLRTRR